MERGGELKESRAVIGELCVFLHHVLPTSLFFFFFFFLLLLVFFFSLCVSYSLFDILIILCIQYSMYQC